MRQTWLYGTCNVSQIVLNCHNHDIHSTNKAIKSIIKTVTSADKEIAEKKYKDKMSTLNNHVKMKDLTKTFILDAVKDI
eukprot:5847236-Ditylum_brightwellii.AAC.1